MNCCGLVNSLNIYYLLVGNKLLADSRMHEIFSHVHQSALQLECLAKTLKNKVLLSKKSFINYLLSCYFCYCLLVNNQVCSLLMLFS